MKEIVTVIKMKGTVDRRPSTALRQPKSTYWKWIFLFVSRCNRSWLWNDGNIEQEKETESMCVECHLIYWMPKDCNSRCIPYIICCMYLLVSIRQAKLRRKLTKQTGFGVFITIHINVRQSEREREREREGSEGGPKRREKMKKCRHKMDK